jgi:hypothetical protein
MDAQTTIAEARESGKLSGRTANALERIEVFTVGQLVERSVNEPLRTPGLGWTGFCEIEELLHYCTNLTLRDHDSVGSIRSMRAAKYRRIREKNPLRARPRVHDEEAQFAALAEELFG